MQSLELKTEHLLLYPCTLSVANSAYGGRLQTEAAAGVKISPDWFEFDGRSLLTYYARWLEQDLTNFTWGLWLIHHVETNLIIGSAGYKGKPNVEGMVEIGYGIASRFRRQGYTFEAVTCLVEWAFQNPDVQVITAECLQNNAGSKRILEKLGMHYLGLQGSYMKWRLPRP